MKILGIESSCDETAAAVVEDGKRLLSNVVASSMDIHVQYGGVVPEIAARSHIESIIPVIEKALADAFPLGDGRWEMGDVSATSSTPNSQILTPKFDPWDQIDGIAVTYGAGLGGCLLVGVLTARTLAIAKNKPLYACNHVEGHVYANFLTETTLNGYSLPASQPQFPLLALIVSGGHSQLVLFRDHFDYTLLGRTHDDAIGEAFDKVAKVIGLPYPGGPSVGKKALEGDPFAYAFPKAKLTTVSPALEQLRKEMSFPNSYLPNPTSYKVGYDFSFSGLKTAVLRAAQEACGKDHTFPSFELSGLLSEAQKANIAASFQRTAVETVVDKAIMAYEEFKPVSVVIAGGVAASPELRKQLAERLPIDISYTDQKLCTDNGAMIATLGCFKKETNQPAADPYKLDIQPNLSM